MYAYVTLVTNADYAIGATALARSLNAVKTAHPLLVLTTPDVKKEDVGALRDAGAAILSVSQPDFSSEFRSRHNRQAQHAKSPFTKGEKPLFHDPLDNFCKLRLWELTDYKRIVFLDADALVIKNIDKLFSYPQFSGAPNLYESLADMHRLNSGVFVAEPDHQTYADMIGKLDAPGAYWPRTDQTFLQ